MAPKKNKLPRMDEFEVERIVGDKYVGGKRFFFIKWKNFATSENTWEPEENLGKCSSLIREYYNGKGLPNSKSHNLSTALLRSLRASKQRRSSISSLISISSPKSSRKLVVCIEPVDVNVFQKEAQLNTNRHSGKSQEMSVLNSRSPRVALMRIDLPETSSKVSLESSADPETTEFSLNGNNVALPKISSKLSVDSKPVETVSFPSGVDDSTSRKNDESKACFDQNFALTVNNADPIRRRSTSAESNAETPSPVLVSTLPVIDESFDDIDDSDEELMSMKVFEDACNDGDEETTKTSKKRKRKRY